jgi:hypothetical protein
MDDIESAALQPPVTVERRLRSPLEPRAAMKPPRQMNERDSGSAELVGPFLGRRTVELVARQKHGDVVSVLG